MSRERYVVSVVILHTWVSPLSSVHPRVRGRSSLGYAGLVRANTILPL